MNGIFPSLVGLTALIVSMSASGQAADAAARLSHSLPVLVDGGGFRTTLMVTNVADRANSCTLRLLAGRLDASDFETHGNLTWNGGRATLALPGPGVHASVAGRNLARSEVYDSAVLDCDRPAVVRIMVTLSRNNVVEAAALLPSARSGAIFRVPVLPRFGDYMFAARNGSDGDANCRIELLDESGVVVAGQSHVFPATQLVIDYLSELVQAPAGFAGGSATASCDRRIEATGWLAGSALSGLPPAVLSADPASGNGGSGNDSKGGDQGNQGVDPPGAPRNASHVRDGATTVLTWDAVAGADYYKIYHDDFWSSGCRLNLSGTPSFCDELAANVTGTSYTHADPDDDNNYYWVVACNAGGCSDIDSDNPATFVDTRPAAPQNVRATRNGSAANLSWDAVAGADYYKIYHDDFWSSGCRLNLSGTPSFCDELAANVTGTSYIHADPDDDNNYYWVVACNSGGCSDIDGDNSIALTGAGGGNGSGNGSGGDNQGAADDHGDDRASATRVTVGSDTSGALTPGDTDWFRVDVNSSGTLEVYTSGSLDSVGRLEDAAGSLVDSDDDGGAGSNFRLSADVDSGAYYVRVKGFGDDEDGSYTLRVRFTSATVSASVPRHPSVRTRFSPPQATVGERVQFILDWNAIEGATHYEVRVDDFPFLYTRNSDGSCSVSGTDTTRETSYTHTFTASLFDNFDYVVQACNSAGCSCPP